MKRLMKLGRHGLKDGRVLLTRIRFVALFWIVDPFFRDFCICEVYYIRVDVLGNSSEAAR